MKLNEPQRQKSEADSLAAVKACKATHLPTPGFQVKIRDSSGFPARGLFFCTCGTPSPYSFPLVIDVLWVFIHSGAVITLPYPFHEI